MKKLFYIGVLSALLLTACGEEEAATITPDEFKQLESGMSPDEVSGIVGGMSKNPDAEENEDLLLFLEYDGENGIDEESSVSLIFKDGKLDTILEDGLTKEKVELTKEQKEKIAENTAKIANEAEIKQAIESIIKSDFKVKIENGSVRIDVNDKNIHEDSKKQMLKKSSELFANLSKVISVTAPSIYWHAPLIDQYGNEKTGEVLVITMDEETFNKVNWDNYDKLDLEVIASSYKQHDALND